MDQHSLDKIFKAGLVNHQTALDKDALWSAIRDDAPSRKGFIPLKILSVVSLVTAIGLSLYIYGVSNRISDTSPQIDSYTSAMELQNQAAEQNTSTISRTLESQAELNQKNQALSPTTTTITAASTEKSTQYRNEKPARLNHTAATGHAAPSANHSADPSTITRNQLAPTEHKKVAPISSNKKTAVSESSSLTAAEEAQAKIASVSKINYPLPVGLDYTRKTPILNKNKKVDCYEYGKKRAKISGEVYSSIDFVANHFSATPDQMAYLERRNQTQTQLEGYRSGLRLKYTLPNGLYIKAGLEAGLIRERFNDQISETTIETRPNQLLDIIMQGDSTIYIYGDEDVQVTRQQLWRVENTYKMLGIPLLLGYERQVGKFKYGIDMGAIHNVLYDFEGYLSNNAGAPTDDPDFFRPSINLSLTGGVTMSYSIGAKTSLFVQATMKHNLEEINNELNEIQQKNTRIGLGVGLEYILR